MIAVYQNTETFESITEILSSHGFIYAGKSDKTTWAVGMELYYVKPGFFLRLVASQEVFIGRRNFIANFTFSYFKFPEYSDSLQPRDSQSSLRVEHEGFQDNLLWALSDFKNMEREGAFLDNLLVLKRGLRNFCPPLELAHYFNTPHNDNDISLMDNLAAP